LRRVALVTGGSRGIGAAVARQLALDGADVAIQYYAAEEAAEAIANECRGLGVSAIAVQADLRSSATSSNLKLQLEHRQWTPNVVVHCAGIAHYGLIEDTEERIWDDLMNVNLKGAYHLTQWFAPNMRWKRWGRFVHMSSVWGVKGAAGEAAYAAAKGGLNSFTKSMAKELASSGITVNAIAPGAIDTDMLAALGTKEREMLCGEIPVGRLGRADEVASLVQFLASDDASYVTGQIIGLNGGWHM
jgi:3-oxoacyl-[acyl-carrier protein] reductase